LWDTYYKAYTNGSSLLRPGKIKVKWVPKLTGSLRHPHTVNEHNNRSRFERRSRTDTHIVNSNKTKQKKLQKAQIQTRKYKLVPKSLEKVEALGKQFYS